MEDVPVRARVSDRQLVDEDPFLQRLDVVDNGHSRSRLIQIVRNIIHNRSPMNHVARSLVSQLLPVQRISLVGVVSHELTIILPGREEKRKSELIPSTSSDTSRQTHSKYGSQIGVAPLVVFGLPPSAIRLTNFQVLALSVLAYKSMRVPLLLQLLPEPRIVPAGHPP
jgi:hypothetical protein